MTNDSKSLVQLPAVGEWRPMHKASWFEINVNINEKNLYTLSHMFVVKIFIKNMTYVKYFF